MTNEELPDWDKDPQVQNAQVVDEIKPIAEPKKAATLIPIKSDGALDFTDQMQLGSAAALAISLKLAPDHLTKEGRPAVMAAMICCKQYNLPATAMNEMGYVKGKLTFFGSLMSALAERHPEYGEKEEFFIDIAGDKICAENKNLASAQPWACVMRVKKKNSTVWNEYSFSVNDAEQAGLLTKTTKPDSGWMKYTKDLLYHKAKNRALKANYSSALNGAQYHEDIEADFKAMHRKPELATAEDLNGPS